jgi:hypothetical protein
MAHGMINESVPILPEDQYVCPARDLEVGLPGGTRPAYVRVEDKALGLNIKKGSKVALKEGRRRLFKGKLINKSKGKVRNVIDVAEYRFVDQFDISAWALMPSRKAPCTPYPAQRTTQRATIAEGEFPLDNLSLED